MMRIGCQRRRRGPHSRNRGGPLRFVSPNPLAVALTGLRLPGAQAGFTLIELMIVVGIIGILVSISSAQYDRYAAKARQSEAKLGLASIYALEKSFYGEMGSYTGCVVGIGFSPEGTKRY